MVKIPGLTLAEDAFGSPAFGTTREDTFVVDARLSSCGRFDVDPSTWGLTAEQADHLKLLNKTLDEATEDALNAGCLTVQKAFGIAHGDTAGMHFCSGENRDAVKREIARYMAAELRVTEDQATVEFRNSHAPRASRA